MNKKKRKLQNNKVSKEVMLRDKGTGRWIKRSDDEVALSENCIPSTFIQIQQNTIHYTDTNLIINEIVKNRHNEKLNSLESTYNTIIDCLDNFRAYSTGIENVFENCEKYSSDFDNEIRRLVDEFDLSCDEKSTEVILDLSKAYLKILFSYMYAAFSLHKGKVKNETVIFGKITSFKEYIQNLLESLLIPSGYRNSLKYGESIYAMFIYEDGFNIEYLNDLIEFDRRFKTPLELIRKLNVNVLSGSKYGDLELSGRFQRYGINSDSVEFVDSLVKLLRDIDRLHKMRTEIGDITEENVFIEFQLQLNNG